VISILIEVEFFHKEKKQYEYTGTAQEYCSIDRFLFRYPSTDLQHVTGMNSRHIRGQLKKTQLTNMTKNDQEKEEENGDHCFPNIQKTSIQIQIGRQTGRKGRRKKSHST